MDGATELLDADRRYLVHPLHHPDDHRQPLLVVEGKGAMLRDAQGREYIDGLSGLWNVNIGHGRAELADAASAQMGRIAFASAYTGATNEPAIRLALESFFNSWLRLTGDFGGSSTENVFKIAQFSAARLRSTMST